MTQLKKPFSGQKATSVYQSSIRQILQTPWTDCYAAGSSQSMYFGSGLVSGGGTKEM